jgi:uncharacterized membrane protein
MNQVSAKMVLFLFLSLALSGAAGDCTYNTLLHGKALLVIATGDAEDLNTR